MVVLTKLKALIFLFCLFFNAFSTFSLKASWPPSFNPESTHPELVNLPPPLPLPSIYQWCVLMTHWRLLKNWTLNSSSIENPFYKAMVWNVAASQVTLFLVPGPIWDKNLEWGKVLSDYKELLETTIEKLHEFYEDRPKIHKFKMNAIPRYAYFWDQVVPYLHESLLSQKGDHDDGGDLDINELIEEFISPSKNVEEIEKTPPPPKRGIKLNPDRVQDIKFPIIIGPDPKQEEGENPLEKENDL